MEIIKEKLLLKNWQEYCSLVADEYDTLKDYNPAVVSHWIALNRSNYEWFKRIIYGIKLIFVSDDTKYLNNPSQITIAGKSYPLIYLKGGQPYATQPEMKNDYEKNHRLYISIGYSNHPYFSVVDNIVFRTVHDLLVHIKTNVGFQTGEINAYNAHVKLAPKEAVPALFTEVVGQAGYVIAKGSFPKQKIDIFKGFDFYKVGEIDDYMINNKELIKKTPPQGNLNGLEDLKEKRKMKTLRLTEKEFKSILKDYINEGLYDNDNQMGAVELDKKSNPNDVKKYTSQGMDVKLVDDSQLSEDEMPMETPSLRVTEINKVDEETFGEEQELVIKHKFDGDSLNIYASRDKVPFSKVLDYILNIKEKDQLKVHQALASNNVTLYIKQAASGRYMHMGNISKKTYDAYLNLLKREKKGDEFAQKTELNENLIRLLKI